MDAQSDVLIVGGGLVGASLACALAEAGLKVVVAETHALRIDHHPNYDERSIALAQGSQRIFAALGLWESMAERACPIHTIHVSDRGRFGFTRLTREQEGVEALGYVIGARTLGNVLIERMQSLPTLQVVAPARLVDFDIGDAGVNAVLDADGKSLSCSATLMVAADGVKSFVRQRLAIAAAQHDYGQTAIIANVTPERGHRNVAYERFTDTGPMALLPLMDDRCALVWTVRSKHAQALLDAEDSVFLERLQERFGYRLGRFTRVGTRHAYRLQLMRARESVKPRLALVGNAVHTLHPVAGQGFNLGLRDVAALAEVVIDAQRADLDIGAMGVLDRYAAWRQADQRRAVAFTDGLVRLFSQPLPPVAWLRDAGMLALDLCPPAKRWFARMTMGRAGRLPRLARGLEL